MSDKSIGRWMVALCLGGGIATLIHVLIISDLGLAIANFTVYAIAIRLTFEVPDMMYDRNGEEMRKEAGYTAILIAVISGMTITISSVGNTFRIGIVTLVLGVSLLMMLFGVWIERARQDSVTSSSP
jgi:hypothetical protein